VKKTYLAKYRDTQKYEESYIDKPEELYEPAFPDFPVKTTHWFNG